ncbi:Rne/Rng family ribonuclease [Jannaschia aquimarina]|uniref:Ribonuclease E n=1 Tax=Jannaschia aquimarina TaxID=935700 RepID=A0A0D1CIZ2_9RHOB|nr:ribonuclease E/G [Jannaschia aquimarina]KIT14687.1 Ribonuclease E [Jannaschia aquimarina]SNT38171.1 RNAse E [Jannaschia aquimarina]
MAKKMLIDATHPEETRVVVADGNKVEEFDFESLNKRQLAGNIYLAKVTRVEPSLQAAFVDYGGNRHGFLAFSEIHPDYYQIPKADRDALLAEERAYAEAMAAQAEREDDDEERAASDAEEAEAAPDEGEDKPKRKSRSRSRSRKKKVEDTVEAGETPTEGEGQQTEDTPNAAEVVAVEGEGEVVSGSGADLSDAADRGDEAEAEADGNDDSKSIAESAGLEDRTLSEGDAPEDGDAAGDEEATTEADADESAAEDAPKAAQPEGPTGMDVVDLDDDAEPNEIVEDTPAEDPAPRKSRSRSRSRRKSAADKDGDVETVADDDAADEVRLPSKPRPRKYKIQEVVKVRQIMLVQVVKEERGNKGAALTTYLSLAGRYCVLMPNTARGGGISRKITNAPDRKKLKEIASEIDVPQGAGLIIRTAGAKRTKTEIKRDYEYLQRQWEQIRELTLQSIAPAPIYEEGNLIHRSIRDLYNREIDEVIVEGEAGYRQAKDYMKLIMPSHAKNVKNYTDPLPLFARYQVESYLDSMFNPTVQLPSGGYIVIGITEALVAVDVNSGRATKEGSIEETALKTNLEAAVEVARQAKLRDLAGLIVIDFIDMDERKNNAAVEKKLKDALKNDRARIQVGRISGFGLLEMSRQRLRPGMLEATTQPCPHCHGTGLIRSDDSIALQVLRMLEEEGTRKRSREVTARVPVKVANYLMNEKREHLAAIEGRYEMVVRVEADPSLIGDELPPLEKSKTASRQVQKAITNVVQLDTSWTPDDDEDVAEPETDEAEDAVADEPSEEDRPKKKRRRRSRRRRGNGGAENSDTESATDDAPQNEGGAASAAVDEEAAAEQTAAPSAPSESAADAEAEGEAAPASEKLKRRTRTRSKKAADPVPESSEASDEAKAAEAVPEEASETEPQAEPEKPKRKSRARAKAPAPEPSPEVAEVAASAAEAVKSEPVAEPAAEPEATSSADEGEPAPKKKRGWWSFGS